MCWTQAKGWKKNMRFNGNLIVIDVVCDSCGKKGKEIYEYTGVEE
jgi:hypothetical protein